MNRVIQKIVLFALYAVLIPLPVGTAAAQADSINVSLGKNVYLSSVYPGYAGRESVLTDGKTDAFCPTTSTTEPRYYMIDLAGYYNINKIELDPRYMYYDYNDTRDTSVYVSDSLLKDTEIETAAYIGSGYSGAEPAKITLDTEVYGRYVYIYKPVTSTRSILCFSEISVYTNKNAYLGDTGFAAVHETSVEISFSYDVPESQMTADNFVLFSDGRQAEYQNFRTEKNRFFLDLCGLTPETAYSLVVSSDVTCNGMPYTISFTTAGKVPSAVVVGKNSKTHFQNEAVKELSVEREGTYRIYRDGILQGQTALPCGRYSFCEFTGDITLERTGFYSAYNEETAQNVNSVTVYGEEKYAEFHEISSDEITVDFAEDGYHLLTLWGKTPKGEASLTPIFDRRALQKLPLSETAIPRSFIVNASSGTHSLKFSCTSGGAFAEYVEVMHLPDMTEENEKAFLHAVKASANSAESKHVLKEFGENYGLSVSNLENGVLYTEPCYASLSGKSFSSAACVMNFIREKMYTARYGASQTVSQSGTTLYVTVPTYGFGGRGALYGGLYEDGRLAALSGIRYGKQTSVTFTFPNTEYNGRMVLKTVLLKDLKSFKPYEKYSNIYKEYYVSSAGSDTNSGTQTAPFATVEKALRAVSDVNNDMMGDIIIHIESGVYYIPETLMIDNSNCGKNGHNVIIRGDENGETLLTGGCKITGWTPYQNGIYKADAEGLADMRNLYVNGLAAERAKSETVLRYDADTDGGFVTKAVSGTWQFAHPEELEVVWNHAFYTRRLLVDDVTQSGQVLNFTMRQPYYDNINNMGTYGGKTFSGNSRFYLENALELLDTKGEFYFDKTNSTVYYYPFDQEDLHTADVYAAQTEGLLQIKGADKNNKAANVVIENISFRYGAWNQTGATGYAGHQSANGFDLTSATVSTHKIFGQLTLTNCENILLKNLHIASHDSTAVVMDTGVTNAEITGSTITDVSGAAIDVGKGEHDDKRILPEDELCADISINNNVIRRTGLEYFNAPGIAVYYADGVKIDHNDIKECSYSGLSMGWGWNAYKAKKSGRFTVTNNRIEDVMCTLHDGGNIYTIGEMPDTLLEGNYIAKNNDTGYGAMYCDSGSRYITIRKNLIAEVRWWLFTQSGYDAQDIFAYNNYSDNLYFTHNNEPLVNTVVEMPTYSVKPYSGEALDIFNNSGVTEAYKGNIGEAERPLWKTSIIQTIPKN